MSEFAFHIQQHGGVVRIVAHQCGWLVKPPTQGQVNVDARPVVGQDVAPRLNVATQVDSSDDSGQGAMSCWMLWNEISLLLHRRGEPDARSTTVRHLFICRRAGSKSSPVMMRRAS